MFRHQLLHDIYTTCAQHKRSVHVYEPEIDVSGFDLVIDDLHSTLRFQLKSKLEHSKTRSWKIYKTLLRPSIDKLNSLPFCPDSGGVGYMGGVILISAAIRDSHIVYSYSYTDVLVLCAMKLGIAAPKSVKAKTQISAVYRELVRVDYRPSLMEIPQNAFWNFPSLSHLLEFAGLYINTHRAVRWNLFRAVSQLTHGECPDPIADNQEDTLAFTKNLMEEFFSSRD